MARPGRNAGKALIHRHRSGLLPVFKVANLLPLCKNTAMQAPSYESTLLESALRKDKLIVGAGLVIISLLAWSYLFYLAQGMGGMGDSASMGSMDMAGAAMMNAWGPVDFLLMFVMWAVMMVGMMVPSATPMILAFANINRRRRQAGSPFVPAGIFLAGYLVIWAGYSAAATLAQWGLHSASLLSPMMASASPVLGGILLISAGAFQLSPLKNACLRRCRTPMSFITNDWREGHQGALLMGLQHGAYCLGCCWALMGLLFLLGVMNLLWIAALAALVLVEKVGPAGVWVGRLAGVGLVAWGIWMLGSAYWM